MLAGHLFVEQDEVEWTPAHHLHRVIGIGRCLYLEALVAQEHAVRLEQLRLVVHPEDGFRLLRHATNVAAPRRAEQRICALATVRCALAAPFEAGEIGA